MGSGIDPANQRSRSRHQQIGSTRVVFRVTALSHIRYSKNGGGGDVFSPRTPAGVETGRATHHERDPASDRRCQCGTHIEVSLNDRGY